MIDMASPQALLRAPLHLFGEEEWRVWYPRVAQLLRAQDADTRAAAVERLATATFWAEDAPPHVDRGEARRSRLHWLLGQLDDAIPHHPDLAAAFLNALRFQGDDADVAPDLVAWLRQLMNRNIPGLPREKIEGAAILIGGLEPWGASPLPPLLDHGSDYVRACAAVVLGRTGHGWVEGEDADTIDTAFLDALTARELVRPGIAGPWWSGTGLDEVEAGRSGFDVVDWMLTILERRDGAEPTNLPCNGIDFHIHEHAAGNPPAIARLIAAGHVALAAMTATDLPARVDVLAPVLHQLAAHPDPRGALRAQIHLAHYYAVLHPQADPQRIRRLDNWRKDADAFVLRYGAPGTFHEQLVLFPRPDTAFTDDAAAALIDAAVPPALRGDLIPHPLDTYGAPPAPYRIGDKELRSYASGVQLELVGASQGEGWQRIDISAGRLGDRWSPWHW